MTWFEVHVPDVSFTTTESLSIAEIARVVGLAFSKVTYSRLEQPEPYTAAGYADFCRVLQIDLAHSLVARAEDGEVVGVAMLGSRGNRGYCADFGVVPGWRGRGIGHRLAAALVETARREGLRSVVLEVRTDNEPARRIYDRAGFRVRRGLVSLVASGAELHLEPRSLVAKVHALPVEGLIASRPGHFPAQPAPCWERELPGLLTATGSSALVVATSGREHASLVWCRPHFGDGIAIWHVGLVGDAAPTGIRAALAHLVAAGARRFGVPGEPEGSAVHRLLESLGFRERARLVEMVCEP